MEDFIRAHIYSSRHRKQILNSELCGCYYCLENFSPAEIKDWIEEAEDTAELSDSGQTALCPECGIDAVIGDPSGYSVYKKFLKKMNKYWF